MWLGKQGDLGEWLLQLGSSDGTEQAGEKGLPFRAANPEADDMGDGHRRQDGRGCGGRNSATMPPHYKRTTICKLGRRRSGTHCCKT